MKWTLKSKLMLSFASFSLLIISCVGIVLTHIASTDTARTLEQQAQRQLLSVRELKRQQIESYLNTIASQVETLAQAPMMQEALLGFHKGYTETSQTPVDERLLNYYQQDFSQQYQQSNNGQRPDSQVYYQSLSPIAKTLQSRYIAHNPNPMGQKDRFIGNQSNHYDQSHQTFHPWLQTFLKRYGYYDIFIVDAKTGNVIYSVFKELDFATSLTKGAFKNSGLAQAYQRALTLKSGQSSIVDFAPYTPSYEAPASFIAAPIFVGQERSGILIFQMPVDKINDLMTNQGNWQDIGLGDSGETYLVGQDTLLRSQSRFFLEDKTQYLNTLKAAAVAPEILEQIATKDSTLGLQPVTSTAATDALAGNSQVSYTQDYRNVTVMSAYSPIQFKDLNWAILAEIDKSEALQNQALLKQSLWQTGLLVCLILVAIASLLGTFIGHRLAAPIARFNQRVKTISSERDLSARIDNLPSGELGELGQSLNQLLKDLQAFFIDISSSSSKLSTTAQQLHQHSQSSKDNLHSQTQDNISIAAATEEMTQTISEVSHAAATTAERIDAVKANTDASAELTAQTNKAMEALMQQMRESLNAINILEEESKSIESVLDEIGGIAEQTNLLALNAAIEAARAGEQGRGFAVVADEVRTLAARTTESTEEVRIKIDKLSQGTNKTVSSVNQANSQTKVCIETITEASQAIISLTEDMLAVNDLAAQIATASHEQSMVTQEISRSVNEVKVHSEDVLGITDEIYSSASLVESLSQEMQTGLAKFKH